MKITKFFVVDDLLFFLDEFVFKIGYLHGK